MKTPSLVTIPAYIFVFVQFTLSTPAATLTNIPMQGSMVHVNIGYTMQDGEANLYAHVEPEIPVLTPLALSNPSDSFETTLPWHSALDPTAGGAAFSRRYGFVLDTASEPLPPGCSLCIRQLTFPPGLRVYRYRANPPSFEPMFGTAESTNLWQWNLAMFHPTYVAPAIAGDYQADYEAFLADSLGQPTGEKVHFTLRWIAVEPLRIHTFRKSENCTELCFSVCKDCVCVAERSLDLSSWHFIAGITNPPIGPQVLTDTNAPSSQAFYRVRLVEP